MGERTIYVTEFDLKRLGGLLDCARPWGNRDRNYLTRLKEELESAQVVSSGISQAM
jgi:hypothetical protein